MRRLRRRLGWTQVELAAALGVTSNSVARWERGEVTIRPPIARLLERIAADHDTPSLRRPQRPR